MGQRTDSVLLVDDEPAVLESTVRLLERQGVGRCKTARSGLEAVDAVRDRDVAAVLLDLGLPDLSGEEVLSRIRGERPDLPVIVVTASVDVETAVRCMAAGAYDYLVKGSDPGRLVNAVFRALELFRKGQEIAALRERMQAVDLLNPSAFSAIVTVSERVRSLFRFIEAVAPSSEPVLLYGETGTGKELFAQAVHKASRLKGPFVATNLGGLDEQVVSDTLFGHTKGAFTGADQVRKGLIATAAEGTLFLDEIGDLSPSSQVKLLRFLESREYYPLGSDLPRKSTARIVAATNRDLDALVEEGVFRKDLLYRLSMFRVDIPPLRERTEDIPFLCQHFLETLGGRIPVLTSGAMNFLQGLSWPGNVRELRGLLLRASVASGASLDRAELEGLVRGGVETPRSSAPRPSPPASPPSAPLPTIRQAIDQLVAAALTKTGGHQGQAALLLGITPQALSKRLKRRGSVQDLL